MPSVPASIVDLVEQVIGVSLLDTEIERALLPLARERARALGAGSPEAYLSRLKSEPRDGAEWTRLISAVTNGQTCFFRDSEQFASLRRLLRAGAGGEDGRLAIWSSACSTGEEPYSIAMVCAEMGIDAQIVGSDINPESLAAARSGLYRPWSLRNVTPAREARWFSARGERYQIDEQIRGSVELVRHNLVLDPPLISHRRDGRWDIIFCRNVLIYFRRALVARVCGRLLGALGSRGALVVAASESLNGLDVDAEPEMLEARIIYRKGRVRRRAEPPPVRRPPRLPRLPTGPPEPPEPRPAERGSIGRVAALARAGKLEEARGLLATAAVGAVERNLTAGHLALWEHRLDEALAHYQKASDDDFLLAEAHYFVGLVRRKRGEWQEASEALRRALFLAPTFWQASYLLAGAHQRLGRRADASRERSRTEQLLAGPPPIMSLLSHPVFVEHLGVQADEVRQLWDVELSRSRST